MHKVIPVTEAAQVAQETSSSINVLSHFVTALIGFSLGFLSRWFFFRKKAYNDLVNSLVGEVESSLSTVFEEAVSFLEAHHSQDIQGDSYIGIKQHLMVARVQHINKILSNLEELNKKKYTLQPRLWIDFRQASDRIFDQPEDIANLARLSSSIGPISELFKRTK